MQIRTLVLAAGFAIALAGGALAQATPTPGGGRALDNPGSVTSEPGRGADTKHGAGAPAGNPTQDNTGSIGHPKSTNSSGATTAPAAR